MKTEEFNEQMATEGLTLEAIPEDVFPVPTGEKGINNPARIIFSSIAGDHEWFTQNDRVVEKAESFDDKGGRRIILKELTPERAVSELERLATKHGKKVARYETRKEGDASRGYWRTAMMPQNTMKILLETTEARTHLPRITTVTSAPLLVEDGKGGVKVLGHGYHPQGGGVFVDCEAEIPEVPLQAAADSLIALHGDFDFCTPADLSRAIGVSLSPALKTFIEDDFPMHVSEAIESQSGKDYLQKVHLRIYAESAMGITKSKGGVGSLDESIFNAILTGRRFLCIGNLRGELDSQVMEDAIRGHRFIQGRGYRMAGTVDTKPLIWQLSTNGAQFTRDIANRSIVTRIRKRASGYKFREYPEGDLLGHIKTNQAYYLGCVFAVIREWVSKGKLKTNDSRHDFRGWCQAVDWIVRNIFHLPPLLDGHKEQLDRTANPDLQWLRDVSNAILNLEQGGSMFTAGGIGAICTEEGLSLPGMRKGSDEKIELVIGRIMGRVFKNHATKVDDEFSRIEVDGNLIIRQSREEYDEQERKNRLAHSYQFTRATPAAAQNSTPTPTPSAACAPVRHGAPKDTEIIRTSSVSVCFPEISPLHAAQAHRESPPSAGGTQGEVPKTVPKEVPAPLMPPPLILAVRDPAAEEKELRRRWAVSISRLKTMTVVPEWFEDPAELEMQGRNLIALVNLTPETEAEFYMRQGDLAAGVEECWLAAMGQKIIASIGYMERPEPFARPATTTSGTSTGAPSAEDQWFTVLAKITERHPLKSQWLSQWQRITLEGNVLKVVVPLNYESLLRSPLAMQHAALIVKLWAELYGQEIEFRPEASGEPLPRRTREPIDPANFEQDAGIEAAMDVFSASLEPETR